MTLITPPEARKKTCPLARVQGDVKDDGSVNGNCRAEMCILWRWKDIQTGDHRYQSALTREIGLIGQEHQAENGGKGWSKDRIHKAAIARLSDNIEGFIIRTDDDRGYCGLAG